MINMLLNLIPSDILNLILDLISPNILYKLNKIYYKKYYYIRLQDVNIRLQNVNIKFNNIMNLNYIKYLIINDCKILIYDIFNIKIIKQNKEENSVYKYLKDENKYLKYENKHFNNFLEFCYYYAKKYNSFKIVNYLNDLIKIYKLEDLIKKWHKNKIKIKLKVIKQYYG